MMGVKRARTKKSGRSRSLRSVGETALSAVMGGGSKKGGSGKRRKKSATYYANQLLILKLKKKINKIKFGGR